MPSFYLHQFVIYVLSQTVLQKLSKDKTVAKNSRVSKVNLEETQVSESILYSLDLQMSIGTMRDIEYELQV